MGSLILLGGEGSRVPAVMSGIWRQARARFSIFNRKRAGFTDFTRLSPWYCKVRRGFSLNFPEVCRLVCRCNAVVAPHQIKGDFNPRDPDFKAAEGRSG